jgi:iron transport multicopper oxidase
MLLSTALVFLSTLSTTYAAIGPIGGLEISNKQISPDGFQRSAVLAGGTFPGPLIKANKVTPGSRRVPRIKIDSRLSGRQP